jgi:hypothetical protein
MSISHTGKDEVQDVPLNFSKRKDVLDFFYATVGHTPNPNISEALKKVTLGSSLKNTKITEEVHTCHLQSRRSSAFSLMQ